MTATDPNITLTGIYPRGQQHSVAIPHKLTRSTLEWLDDLRDSSPEVFELFATLHPDGVEHPSSVLIEDSVVAWFDSLNIEAMAVLHERQPDVLDELAAAPSATVRRSVAANVHTPRFILNRLCHDHDVEVVIAACASARVSAAAHLLVLSRIEAGQFADMQVRRLLRAIAACPTVSSEALRACQQSCPDDGDLADFIASRLLTRSNS